jgi:YesN/AraC family two-component response regulator
MVCSRCIMAVTDVFSRNEIIPVNVSLGEVLLNTQNIPAGKYDAIDKELRHLGFEVIGDKKSRLIEKIKNSIVQLVHHSEDAMKINLSDYLAEKLHYDYAYLSNLFSEVEGTTIEKYYISQKIERVKELLVYDELSLSEIADKLNYSSVAYLSGQFKKVTGLTPTYYKSLKEKKRLNIEEL